jgi:hypothetical protein
MTKIQKIKSYFMAVLIGLIPVFVAIPVLAAEISFDTKVQEINVGQQFQVNVILNTEGEELNAVEGNVIFPNDLATLKEIRDGNSIISFWIERPHERQETRNKEQGEIMFSGIIPGGYKETNGFLFSALFTAKTEGKGIIEFRNIRALKNDGLGTPANVKISNFQFNIKDVRRPYMDVRRPEIKDSEPPEDFKPEIASDPNIFDGKYFLVFAAQDKGLGIEHYEVLESRKQKIENRRWETAGSPYLLKDQKLRSFIYVKVIDKAGNERIVSLAPRYPLKWYEFPLVWIIIILGVVILYIFRKILWQEFIKSR